MIWDFESKTDEELDEGLAQGRQALVKMLDLLRAAEPSLTELARQPIVADRPFEVLAIRSVQAVLCMIKLGEGEKERLRRPHETPND